MRRVIVNMRDYIFADAIAQSLQADKAGGFTVQRVTTPEEVEEYSKLCEPYAVLMEVTGNRPYALEQRLKLRDTVKETNPDCKIVILVDDQADNELAETVKSAKRDGLIDAFLFGTVTEQYMAAVMDSL